MKNSRFWSVGLFVCFALANLGAAGTTKIVASNRLPFHVDLPTGFHVEHLVGPDFDVYYFNQGKRSFAGAYVGTAPHFHDPCPEKEVCQSVVCVDHRPVRREVLYLIKQDPYRFPISLHAWTNEVANAQERGKAEAILLSIRGPGHGDALSIDQLKSCP